MVRARNSASRRGERRTDFVQRRFDAHGLRLAALALVAAFVALGCDRSPYREVDLDSPRASPHVESGAPPSASPAFRVSVAGMESPRETYSAYARLFEEIGRRLGTDVTFIQRKTYSEINELLAAGGLEAALLCTGGYLELERTNPGAVEPIAVPIVHGADTYQALLLVPSGSTAASLADLRGKRFAFTDSLSLSGHAWTVHELDAMHATPDAFFGSVIFTAAHDRSIMAVARGLVDGASVHGIIYDHMLARDPSLAAHTRIIQRSPAFGMTPLVVSTRVPRELRSKLARVLTTLADDPAGERMLHAVQIDMFATPSPNLYQSAARTLAR